MGRRAPYGREAARWTVIYAVRFVSRGAWLAIGRVSRDDHQCRARMRFLYRSPPRFPDCTTKVFFY